MSERQRVYVLQCGLHHHSTKILGIYTTLRDANEACMAQADAISFRVKSPSPKQLPTEDSALVANPMVLETVGGVRY